VTLLSGKTPSPAPDYAVRQASARDVDRRKRDSGDTTLTLAKDRVAIIEGRTCWAVTPLETAARVANLEAVRAAALNMFWIDNGGW